MQSIMYRLATSLDAPDLLRWKNDPETREFSISTHDEITEERHAIWMKAMLENPNVRTYIIESNGYPCGDIRVEVHAHYIEIAIKLDRRFRGIGIGTAALKTIGELVQKEFKKRSIAKIVYGNIASMRLFQNCGYVVSGYGDEGYYICSKDYIPI